MQAPVHLSRTRRKGEDLNPHNLAVGGFRDRCSTIERPFRVVESAGVEPAFLVCRTSVRPLDDDPVEPTRIERASPPCESGVLPLDYGPVLNGVTDGN